MQVRIACAEGAYKRYVTEALATDYLYFIGKKTKKRLYKT